MLVETSAALYVTLKSIIGLQRTSYSRKTRNVHFVQHPAISWIAHTKTLKQLASILQRKVTNF